MARPSKYPPEFREQAVELVRASDTTVAAVARDLGIDDTTLGNWVKADQAERGVPDAAGLLPLTAAEPAELTNGELSVDPWGTVDLPVRVVGDMDLSRQGSWAATAASGPPRSLRPDPPMICGRRAG